MLREAVVQRRQLHLVRLRVRAGVRVGVRVRDGVRVRVSVRVRVKWLR